MLFDLRSRGRRRTVQVLYIGLAVLIGSGLILFGVGTGGSGGGLFGAFTGGGASNSANSAVNAAVKKASAAAQKNPQSASAWAALINARQSAANVGNSGTTYTAAGKQQLALLVQDYGKYTALVKTPSVEQATLAAQAYSKLGNYKDASATYQTVLTGEPGSVHALECVALESYAAGNTRVGQLAESKVLAKPAFKSKTVHSEVKTELEAAKKTPSTAAQTC